MVICKMAAIKCCVYRYLLISMINQYDQYDHQLIFKYDNEYYIYMYIYCLVYFFLLPENF